MEFRRRWQVKSSYKRQFAQLIIGVLLGVLFLYFGGKQTNEYTKAKQLQLVEEAIKRAVVQCYGIEGVYPPDMAYIQDNYGIKVDEKKYIVHYEIFASNIMPDISVLSKE